MKKSILENIILPIGDLINNSTFLKELKKWRKIDNLSEKELQELQEENLKKILSHTVKTVPYYKNVSLEGKTPYEWIKNFPILTKDILRNKNDELISKLYKKENLIPYSSSGSTGVQTTVYMNKKEQSIIRAILIHWWEWCGYEMGKPLVQTGITPSRGVLKKIKDYLFNTYYLVAFSITEKQLEELCNSLHKNTKYQFLVGYASSLNIIADYALKNSYNIKFQSVISLGDKLFTHYKKNIENTFKTKVFDTYGANEGFLIASEKDLEYKYIMSPHVYLEILDDNNMPVKDGEMGNIVVTRLDGFSMPLIRYRIGDLGIVLPQKKYPKNREYNYPLLQQIIGRETDVVLLPNNSKLIVHSFTGIFEYYPQIKQFKVIQKDKKGIIIEYIKAKDFNQDILNSITEKLQYYIQNVHFEIKYKEVSYISPSKSGKTQIIESKL